MKNKKQILFPKDQRIFEQVGENFKLARKRKVTVYFPYSNKLYNDNAAMIGIAAYFKYKEGIYLKSNFNKLDRIARPYLKMWVKK